MNKLLAAGLSLTALLALSTSALADSANATVKIVNNSKYFVTIMGGVCAGPGKTVTTTFAPSTTKQLAIGSNGCNTYDISYGIINYSIDGNNQKITTSVGLSAPNPAPAQYPTLTYSVNGNVLGSTNNPNTPVGGADKGGQSNPGGNTLDLTVTD